jgi:drug/metabolite transporter (DMT)-like permease
VLFILSLSRATAAFVLLLQCTSPFVAAILARVFLRERVRRDTVVAMLVASVGVAIMVGGGLDGGDRLGILLSLLLPVFLGGYTVLIRSSPARDPGVPIVIGGFAVAVVAGLVSLVGPGLDLPIRDVAMGCIGGGLLIGLGAPVFNYAHRFVPPAETSLLLISEIVLAPLWLWAWPGEVPSASTLVGGGVDDYNFPAFFDDYRVGLIYGWVIPVFAVGSLDVSSERAMTLWTNVVERVQDAIFQHGAQRFVDLG